MKRSKVQKRTCVVCGCTDDRACPGGCSWVGPRICSRCQDLVGLVVATMRATVNGTLTYQKITEIWSDRRVRRALRVILREGVVRDGEYA